MSGDASEAGHAAAVVGDDCVGGAVEVHHRHGPDGSALLVRDPEGAGDRGDRRDHVRGLAAEAVREEAAVGHPGRVHPAPVDADARREVVDQRAHERDVVDVSAHRGPAAVPGVPRAHDPARVHADEALLVRLAVHAAEQLLLRRVGRVAVEVEDERDRRVPRVRIRDVHDVLPREAAGLEREREVVAAAQLGRALHRAGVGRARVAGRRCGVGRGARGVLGGARVTRRGAVDPGRGRVARRDSGVGVTDSPPQAPARNRTAASGAARWRGRVIGRACNLERGRYSPSRSLRRKRPRRQPTRGGRRARRRLIGGWWRVATPRAHRITHDLLR